MSNKCLYFLLFLFFLGSSTINAQQTTLEINNYQLIGKTRVGRTIYQYEFQADITNNGTEDVLAVNAAVTSTSPTTVVTTNILNFGDISAEQTVTSSNTFTLKIDRRYSFDESNLVWEIYNYAPLPPDPGEAGKETLEGIDTDEDGVRDDVQIAIAKLYPVNENTRLTLTQLATSIQQSIIAVNSNNNQELSNALNKIILATECISIHSNNPWEDVIFIQVIINNTTKRAEAYYEANNLASGNFFGGNSNLENECNNQ